MSLVKFLIILGIGTALSWTSWWLVVTTLDPIEGGAIARWLFYGCFFLVVFGTVTLIGFFVRLWLEKNTVLFRQVASALRHGVLVSSGSTLALLLQSRRLLNVWAGLALVFLVVLIELFFLAGQTKRMDPSRT